MEDRLTAQRTIADHEVSFREANEQIEASADAMALLAPVPFTCECPQLTCTEVVKLTLEEYEAIRQHPRRFFNVPGHEQASVAAGAEVVLMVFDRYAIVEKIGVAGEIAAAAHDAACS